ncbi:MAG: SusC/RagA family TonB-linked outer membrane protein [Gemmatimonadaceae bacterium]
MTRTLRRMLAVAVALAGVAGRLAAQETGSVGGRVVDAATQQPILDASVFVVGTQRGAVTGSDGQYRIAGVPAGPVQLRARRIGYETVTQPVTVVAGQDATVDFALNQAARVLEEVITTVTGAQRRLEVGNDIAQVNADSVVSNGPVANITDLLTTRVAGVQVLPGHLTGTGARVRIRGTNSLSLTNNPIYIIDGIRMESGTGSSSVFVGGATPGRVNDLNAEEIESIEVVKGPSAATLYGTDAANGVIVITTKRGSVGPTRWNIYMEQGAVVDLNDYPTAYTNVGKLQPSGAATNSCFLTSIAAGTCISDSLRSYSLYEDDEATPNAAGHRQQYGLQVSGGTERLRYFVSGEWEDETGRLRMPEFAIARLRSEGVDIRDEWERPNALRKTSARANLNVTLAQNADLAISAGLVSSSQRLPQTDNNVTGITSHAYGGPGFRDAVDANGDQLFGYRAFTPDDIFQETVTQDVNRFIGSVGSNWTPLSWLTARGTFGFDFTSRVDSDLCRFENCPDQGDDRLGFRESHRTTLFQYTADVGTTGTFRLTPWLNSRTTVGVQYFQNAFARTGARGEQLPPGATTITQAAVVDASESTSETRTLGAFIEQTFAVNDRLFVTGAVRADDNSAFGADFDAVYYPKFSASWLVSDEPFFPSIGFIDQLRLRAAIGASGVQPGTTDAVAFFTAATARLDQAELPGLQFTELGNPDLKPERTREIEVGADATLWNDRLNLQLTYYHKQSKDALVNRILPPSLGVGSTGRFENLGEVRNSGWEGLVSAQLITTRSFGWDVTLSGSTNSNELVDLGGVAPIVGNTISQIQGYPLNGYWQRPLKSFSDADGNGLITVNEIVVGDTAEFLGYSIPRHEVALASGVDLFNRHLRLAALIDYKGGHKLLNDTERLRCQNRLNCRGLMDPSAPLFEQARSVAIREHPSRTFGGYIEEADYIRFRELSLTLVAPDRWAGRLLSARSLSVTLAARNLGFITDYTGIDPESSISNQLSAPSDFQAPPPPSLFTFRLNIGF